MTRKPPIREGEVYKNKIDENYTRYALVMRRNYGSMYVLGMKKINGVLNFEGLFPNRWYCPMEMITCKNSFSRYMGPGYTIASYEETKEIKEFVRNYFIKATEDNIGEVIYE